MQPGFRFCTGSALVCAGHDIEIIERYNNKTAGSLVDINLVITGLIRVRRPSADLHASKVLVRGQQCQV